MTSFRHENVPLALEILIDNSGSMRPKRQKVNEAALNLVRSSNAHDEVFVVNFGEQYYLDQDFTDDIAKLKTALDKVETWGSTALYDALVASAAHIRQDARIQKRVLLVVTDGKDNASQESLDETVQQLQREDGPVVYVIAFVGRNEGREFHDPCASGDQSEHRRNRLFSQGPQSGGCHHEKHCV
jgi:VWFA-related protein